MWRRLKAFHRFGAELQLICWWWDNPPTTERVAAITRYAQLVKVFPINRSMWSKISRAVRALRYPPAVSSRILSKAESEDTLNRVKTFGPDILFLDGIYGGQIARYLHKALNVPLITRSHNIEHLYYRRLLQTGSQVDKLRIYCSLVTLERYERTILQNSALFYDISTDDLAYWQQLGFRNGRYLPPIVKLSNKKTGNCERNLNYRAKKYDVVFLGNLYSPNNVSGIRWFLLEVLPVVRLALPELLVLIAGLNPVDSLKQLCDDIEGVDLLENPLSSQAVYEAGRVLINPVGVGSGVSIKTLEMMSTGKPIVSRSHGLAGLPDVIRPYFRIADDSRSFADNIIALVTSKTSPAQAYHELLEPLFGEHVVKRVLEELRTITA